VRPEDFDVYSALAQVSAALGVLYSKSNNNWWNVLEKAAAVVIIDVENIG